MSRIPFLILSFLDFEEMGDFFDKHGYPASVVHAGHHRARQIEGLQGLPKHTGTSSEGGSEDHDEELVKVMAAYGDTDLQQHKLGSQLSLLPEVVQAMGYDTSRFDIIYTRKRSQTRTL